MGHDSAKDIALSGRMLVSAVSNYAGKITTLGVGFLLTPFMLHRLGPAPFGLWVILGAIAGYSSLGDLGISGAVVRYVAELRAKQEFEHVRRLVATALWAGLFLGATAIAVGIALASMIPRLLAFAPSERGIAAAIVAAGGAMFGAAIFSRITQAVLQGLQRFDLLNLLNVANALSFTVAAIALILIHAGVVGLAFASVATTLLMQPLAFWCLRHAAPELRLGWRGANRSDLRLMLPYSASFVADQAAWRLKTETDELVIGLILSVAAATPYALARRLSLLVQSLADQFLAVLVPLAAELHADADRQRMRTLFIASTRITLAISLPLGMLLIIFARPVLAAWVGPEYVRYAHLVVILTLVTLIDLSTWPAGGILKVMARYRLILIGSTVTALANLALSIALATRLGVTGVALGTLIPGAFESLVVVLPYAMRVLGVDSRAAARLIVRPVLLPAAPTAVALVVMRRLVSPASWAQLGAVAVCGGVLYAGLYVTIGATATEREGYRHFACRVLRLAPR
jgi:O-antigen/teichoic acid export membrane protein